MTIWDLALLVKKMRDAQKNFFKNRNADNLKDAKHLEKVLDQTIQDILQDNKSPSNSYKHLEEVLDKTIQDISSRLSTSNGLYFEIDVTDLH